MTWRVPVDEPSQVGVARSVAVRAAGQVGLPRATLDTVSLVATELAHNLHRHAEGGELLVVPSAAATGVAPDGSPGRMPGLQLVAVDRGPGVRDFDRCLADGYSTSGTLGTGLGAVRRLAQTFDAASEPGRGTVVAAGFGGPATTGVDVAALGFPIRGESVNGDGWAVERRGARVVLLVADGLGHGPGAAEASRAAVELLPSFADAEPGRVVVGLDQGLQGSRGAAVTVAVADVDGFRAGGVVRSAGLGNVSLLVAGPEGEGRRVATSHGTAGAGRRARAHEQATPLPAGGVVVLHSDGLTSRWSLEGRRELLRHDALVIAAALLRDHERGSDDTQVVVARAARGGGPR